jgi:hypothetical protein
MTDRELLELAAKAAGIDWIKDCVWIENGFYSPLAKHERISWNPLTDDGDALRLAVKLEIAINPWAGKTVCWHEDSKVINHEKHDCNDDPYAATRRAIVMAAAEIGRSMK